MHQEVEQLLEAKIFLLEQEGGAGSHPDGQQGHEKGHLQADPDAVEIDAVVKDADPLRTIAGKPLQGEPFPGQGGKLRIVERQHAGHQQGGEQEGKIEDHIKFEARASILWTAAGSGSLDNLAQFLPGQFQSEPDDQSRKETAGESRRPTPGSS